MKKGMLFLGFALLMVILVGCGDKSVKVECVKEYSGMSHKYDMTFEKDTLTYLMTEQLTTIIDDDQVDVNYQNIVNQIPGLKELYPNAKIEGVKNGNIIGMKMEFDTKSYSFDKLTIEFKLNDVRETIEKTLADNEFVCKVVK